jgi:magnesium chelatase subunit I
MTSTLASSIHKITTLAALKKSGYQSRSVKQELRENLIHRLKNNELVFPEIKGFEDTVIPQVQAALLSRHNMILLGLRGQAKTRIARLLVQLLDEYIPYVSGSEINDDPLQPISVYAKNMIQELGDKTPISWLHRDHRYTEKLATPDVSVADLIGDLDPIKAATQKLTYADERAIHFGLIPRSHRGIFVINELPDLQARIQVALFNMLQEGDIQIRGFQLRLPLDIQFVFTANPEDYTNRGSIVTPLKDRIESQILTHYPKSIEVSKSITRQEAKIHAEQEQQITLDELIRDLVELIAFEARKSELVDQKSGVSARLTISALENIYSVAERRMLLNHESSTEVRITDLYGAIPSITGKVELVYEGELEGAASVAKLLVGKAIRNKFEEIFPNPEKIKKTKKSNPYLELINWFNEGNSVDFLFTDTDKTYAEKLNSVPGLAELIKTNVPNLKRTHQLLLMELALHGLAEFSQLSKHPIESGIGFMDLMSMMFDVKKNNSPDEDFGS